MATTGRCLDVLLNNVLWNLNIYIFSLFPAKGDFFLILQGKVKHVILLNTWIFLCLFLQYYLKGTKFSAAGKKKRKKKEKAFKKFCLTKTTEI